MEITATSSTPKKEHEQKVTYHLPPLTTRYIKNQKQLLISFLFYEGNFESAVSINTNPQVIPKHLHCCRIITFCIAHESKSIGITKALTLLYVTCGHCSFK